MNHSPPDTIAAAPRPYGVLTKVGFFQLNVLFFTINVPLQIKAVVYLSFLRKRTKF